MRKGFREQRVNEGVVKTQVFRIIRTNLGGNPFSFLLGVVVSTLRLFREKGCLQHVGFVVQIVYKEYNIYS